MGDEESSISVRNGTAAICFVISYNLANTGKTTLVLDPTSLKILGADGTRVSVYALSRQSTSGFEGRVPPGQAERGVIWIPGAPAGQVLLRWPVAEIGTGNIYTISQHLP